MPYTFPNTLIPVLSDLIIASDELKDIRNLITPINNALTNPFGSLIDSTQSSISTNLSIISSNLSVVNSDISDIDGWLASPPGSLPSGWTNAGFDETDLQTVRDNYANFQTNLTTLQTAMTDLQTQVNNFETHTNRLSGENLNPTVTDITEVNFIALMGITQAWELELHRWELDNPFENKIEEIFGALFNGDTLTQAGKTESDKTPVSDVSSFDISNRIENV